MNLFLGDSFEYMKSTKDNSVDLIVTDPPYDLSTVVVRCGNLYNGLGFRTNRVFSDLDNKNISSGYDIELFGTEFLRILKSPNIYLFCNKMQIPDYFNFYVTRHRCKFDILSWHKTNPPPMYNNKYVNDTEYILYFHEGNLNPKSYQDALTYYLSPSNQSDKSKYKHPTIKPVELVRKFIRNSSNTNDIVFDPFMGSGTTGVASVLENRDFVGCEIIESYFNTAKERIELTQESAKFGYSDILQN